MKGTARTDHKKRTVRAATACFNAATALTLVVCSCATGYQPLHSGKGYSDWPISTNEFAVSFIGNGETDAQRAADFALLRSAQVTLQHGFSRFAVLDVTNTSSARPYTVRQRYYTAVPPSKAWPPFGLSGSWPYEQDYLMEYDQPRVFFKPGTVLRIKCFASKPEKPFTYDAAALQKSLKQKYKLG
ncbi:MAG TPA: hypothetical protein VKY92_14330 [Verrucomicrobiae bacterium]|nr:hypothetical protein [Verrucomicrobiae bacterium]